VTVDPTEVAVKAAPLSSEQQKWLDRALECVDDDALLGLVQDMINVPSPTGDEKALAQFLVAFMRDRDLVAVYQEIDEHRGNSLARVPGRGDGPDLLFYGHLDTSFTGRDEDDYPVVGDEPRPDLRPHARIDGDLVCGLGVSNPKGGDACAIMALDAVRRAGIPLRGTVTLGLVAGGIHKRPIRGVHRSYAGREYLGFGIGCEFMLKHGVRSDFCISTKPGYSVVWEEPGECWFTIRVKGSLCYTGLRHVYPYRSPIVDATSVIQGLEAWFPEYTRMSTRGLIAPQGAIGAIEAGWPFKPEFVPGICILYVDVRTNARTDPLDVKRQFDAALAEIQSAHPGLALTSDMVMSAPGSRTDPDNWIIQSCLRAWETVEKRAHVFARETSGTTDGNVLRTWGIPTARLGLPGLVDARQGWPPMFDACRIEDLGRLTRCYVHALIDTCTRSREPTTLRL
jgi:acetylornithine deacetylase/succinyl-diaminopimelate desuccinylase-like protein